MKELNYYRVQELNSSTITDVSGGGDIAYKLAYLFGMLINQGPTQCERMNKY